MGSPILQINKQIQTNKKYFLIKTANWFTLKLIQEGIFFAFDKILGIYYAKIYTPIKFKTQRFDRAAVI